MSDETPEIDYKLQHSTFFEETFKMPSLGISFLKHFLPPEMVERLDIEKLTVEQEKLVDDVFRETRPDIVYHVPILGVDERVSFQVVLEHKSYDDHSAIFQLWKYLGQLCIQDVKNRLADQSWTKDFRLAPIVPIILHHGETPFTGKTQLAELFYPLPGAERFLPRQEAILVDLTTIDVDQIPRDPDAPELHVVMVILKIIFSKDKELFKRKFCEIVEELQPFTQNPRHYELARGIWYYMIRYAKNMTKTDFHEVVTEVRKNVEEGDKMSTLAQIFIDEGIALGKTEGKAEGILRTLKWRFHAVPESLQAQVPAITNLASLDDLADFAFVCESLDDFAAAL